MYKVLHPKDDVDRLYVIKTEGGRGFIRIEDYGDTATQELEVYTKIS